MATEQQKIEWQARKATIQRRAGEIAREQSRKEFRQARERQKLLDLSCQMVLQSEGEVDRLKQRIKAVIVEKAAWITKQKSSGRNMDLQEMELDLTCSFLESVEGMQSEFQRFIQSLSSTYRKQVGFYETKMRVATAEAKHHDECFQSTNQILKTVMP